jgi:hypothetical protein
MVLLTANSVMGFALTGVRTALPMGAIKFAPPSWIASSCHRAGHFGPDPLAPRNDEDLGPDFAAV